MARAIWALSLVLALASPVCARPAPAAPAATPFALGTFKLVALRDMANIVPNDGSVFGKDVGPDAVAGVLRKAGAPTDQIPLGVDALLVAMPGHVVLIDTGLGPKVGGVLQASLAAAGVKPEAITDVLITHSHGDHVGGLITAEGALAFPNATIRMSAPEWAFLQKNTQMAALAKAIAPRVKAFAPGSMVVPGITSVPLAGHTPGHSGYEIVSGKARLIDIGDTAHSAIVSLAEPGWVIGYDQDAREGIAQREAELARLAKSHERIFAPHFPYPGVGFIVAKDKGYAWQPALP